MKKNSPEKVSYVSLAPSHSIYRSMCDVMDAIVELLL